MQAIKVTNLGGSMRSIMSYTHLRRFLGRQNFVVGLKVDMIQNQNIS